MSGQGKGRGGAGVETCNYAPSRQAFRGPKRNLATEYVAFLGGTETYGKFVERPFPQELEALTGVCCVNLGLPNAGIEVMLGDPGLARIASGAAMAVVQVPCAANRSNRFYKVHPRRNDRFVKAEPALQALFEDVDFTEFSFTRHMLMHLRALSPERFETLRRGLAEAWIDGMRRLIAEIRRPVALLWFSDRSPGAQADGVEPRCEPVLVDARMLAALEGHVAGMVEVRITAPDPQGAAAAPAARGDGDTPPQQGPARPGQESLRSLPGQAAHAAAAEALVPLLAQVLDP